MEQKHYQFFQNRECEYFPCHKTDNPEEFNCLFCYCPLYMLGKECRGDFLILENGIKSCENCMYPHRQENYDRINERFSEIAEKMKERL